MKRVVYGVGTLIGILCALFFLKYLEEYWYKVANIHWDSGTLGVVLGLVFLYMLTVLFAILGWWFLLRGVGETTKVVTGLEIGMLSQLGKYLPGNVGHHIGKVTLAKQHGMNLSRVLFSVLMEIFCQVGSSAILTGIALFLMGDILLVLVSQLKLPSMFEMALIPLVLLVLSPLLAWGLKRWNTWQEESQSKREKVLMPSLKIYFVTFLLHLSNYSIMGTVLYLLGRDLYGVDSEHWLLIITAFIISATLGFITPGAPAGLGVRELLLVGILGETLGHSVAIGMASMLRLITTLGDGFIFFLGLRLRHNNRKKLLEEKDKLIDTI